MQYLKSITFNAVFYASLLLQSAIVALSRLFMPFEKRFALAAGWAHFIMRALKAICNLDYVVEGRENMPTDSTAVVYIKHSSTWETIAEIAICPAHTWVLKRELMWIPVLGWALSAMRAIPINRKGQTAAAQQVLQHGHERLNNGINVMVFPEGTRMTAGTTRRYGRSGALLAIKAGRPLIPIAHNAADFWPRDGLLIKPGLIRFCIGPPINTNGKTADEVNALAKDWIDTKMAQISPAHGRCDASPDAPDANAASTGPG